MPQHPPPFGPYRPLRDDVPDTAHVPEAHTAEQAAHVLLAAVRLGVSIWMTCADDGREHAVTDPDFVAGYQAGGGTYWTVCDRIVSPRAVASTPSAACERCERRLQERAQEQPEPYWMRWISALLDPATPQKVIPPTSEIPSTEDAETRAVEELAALSEVMPSNCARSSSHQRACANVALIGCKNSPMGVPNHIGEARFRALSKSAEETENEQRSHA